MGAQSTGDAKKKNPEEDLAKLPFADRQSNYINSQKLFNDKVLTGPFNDEMTLFLQEIPIKVDETIKALFTKNKTLFNNAKINEQKMGKVLQEWYVEKFIKTKLMTRNVDVFSYANEIKNSWKDIVGDAEAYKKAIAPWEKDFETKMRMITISLCKKENCLPWGLWYAVNRQLKFNVEYQPSILNWVINDKLLWYKDFIKDICDWITNASQLKIVNVILNPIDEQNNLPNTFGMSCGTYESLYKIMESISINRNIKSWMWHSVKDYNIHLAPEVFMKIQMKLQSETWSVFHWGNFKWSNGLFDKLLFQIASTRSLKVLSLHWSNINTLLNTRFFATLKQNLSLTSFIWTGFEFKSNKDKKEITTFNAEWERGKDNKKNMICTYYLGEKSVVNYPMEIPLRSNDAI